MISELGFNRLDLAIGIFIALFCILGLIKGAVRQFFSILAFIFATIISAVLPHYVKLPVISDSSFVWGYIILAVLIWIPSYLILNSIGGFIANRVLKAGIRIGDHLWGFCFGCIRGLTIVMLIAFLMDSLSSEIKQYLPAVGNAMDNSKVISFIQPYNPFLKLHIMQNLRLIINSVNDPDYMELLADDPNFKELMKQESIKEILDDPEIKNILNNRQYMKFIGNPKIQQLVKDPKALQLLVSTDVDKAVIDNI